MQIAVEICLVMTASAGRLEMVETLAGVPIGEISEELSDLYPRSQCSYLTKHQREVKREGIREKREERGERKLIDIQPNRASKFKRFSKALPEPNFARPAYSLHDVQISTTC